MKHMSKERTSYRSMIKGTAIFGGVQLFNIIINIVRGKLIAVLLGPVGMGISAMLTSTMNSVNQLTGLGLDMGAMRNISIAASNGDEKEISRVVTIFRKLVIYTAILGASVCLLGCVGLSKFVFGNDEYWWMFALLSVMQFFTAIGAGETTLLQGTRKLKALATTSLIGTTVGLLVGIPLYYFYGKNGIAPGMCVLAVATYFSNKYFTSKIIIKPTIVAIKDVLMAGKEMVGLGLALTLSSIIGSLTLFIINFFIRKHGSVTDVGFFQAASSITTQYLMFVFSAMAVDYYPRLSAVSNDSSKTSKLMNQQGEIMILLAAPLVMFVFCSANFIIKVLLTKSFISIIPLVYLLALSLYFKAAAYSVGYVSFSQGDKKAFFWMEGVFSNLMNMLSSILFYYYLGLIGLGVAALLNYGLYFLVICIFVKKRYGISANIKFVKLFLIMGCFCFISYFIAASSIFGPYKLSLLIANFAGGSVYAFYLLEKRINFLELVKSKITNR